MLFIDYVYQVRISDSMARIIDRQDTMIALQEEQKDVLLDAVHKCDTLYHSSLEIQGIMKEQLNNSSQEAQRLKKQNTFLKIGGAALIVLLIII